MKISPVYLNIKQPLNTRKAPLLHQKSYDSVSFSSTKVRHSTAMFREDIDWKKFQI